MKRTIYNISALLFLILATIGCREKDLNESGLLRLSIGIKDKVETVTRTLSDEEQNALKGNAKIRIYSGTQIQWDSRNAGRNATCSR